jgi:hypothetical protein
MFNEINYQYSEYKNQEFLWFNHDSEELYLKNIESNYQQLSANGWVNRQFTYKFNSHGFRSDKFSNEDSIMFLGCSHTFGLGLPLEDTWAYQVAKSLNLKCFNLSVNGSGPDTAFRLANHYIPQIKPKIVVYLEPHESRFTLLSANGRFYNFSIGTHTADIDPLFVRFYEHWLSLQENLQENLLKHRLAIQFLCQQDDIKFLFLKSYSELPFFDYARDLAHAGINSNIELTKIILDRINQNN